MAAMSAGFKNAVGDAVINISPDFPAPVALTSESDLTQYACLKGAMGETQWASCFNHKIGNHSPAP